MTRLSLASLTLAWAASLLAIASSAYAQTAQPAAAPELHEADKAFVADGTKAVSTQRDAARLADSRSTDREVKAFAERVANDDAKLSDALRAASPRGVDVPHNDPDTAVLDSIKDLRGGAFDKAYIEQVALADEQKTLSVFQAEIASGRNEQLKQAARAGLPTIQAHYAQAQELAKRKHLEGSAQ
jgi:putative membrane protein